MVIKNNIKLDCIVCSYGGVATSFLITYLSKICKTNHVGDKDGLKHAVPDGDLNEYSGGIKFIFVIDDPILALLSLYRRGFQRPQALKLQLTFASPFWKNLCRYKYGIKIFNRIKLRSLKALKPGESIHQYLKTNINLFPFDAYTRKMMQGNSFGDVLIIKTDHLWSHKNLISKYLNLKDGVLDSFPKKKDRASSYDVLSEFEVKKLQKWFSHSFDVLRSLDDPILVKKL